MEESQATLSSNDIVSELKSSIAASNENFDASVRGEQLRLDLMYRWMRCSSNGTRPDISIRWFEKLCQCHTEKQRSYHTLMHLEEMFLYFDIVKKFKTQGKPPMSRLDEDAIVLATFFHDAIYNVHSSTNEEDSAALFQRYISEFGDNSLQGLESFVTQLILATKKHEVSEENPPCLALFLDLDMAVLGKEMQAYVKYASYIRMEYAHVPHEVYCEKRADVLETFLTQQQIFGTQAMVEAFEQRARDNLASEIEILRRGVIPGTS